MKKLKNLIESGACTGSTTVPMEQRPTVDRGNVGPLVRGYVESALQDFPFHELNDVPEYLLQQIIRDCVSFYWRNRKMLESLWNDPFDSSYSEKQTGRDFFLSRNSMSGFIYRADPFDDDFRWDALHASALGYGPFYLQTNDESELYAHTERDPQWRD